MGTELRKLAGLPSVWVAAALGLLMPPLLVKLAGQNVADRSDSGYVELTVGVLGALVLGAVAAGSEYRGRQIRTSLLCVPSRLRLLAAKTAAVALCVAALAAVSAVVTLTMAGAAVADARVAGVVVYWVLDALLAFGISLLLRSGIIPLTVMIINTTAVSFTYLLTKVTPLAEYLPDMAGAHMFIRDMNTPNELAPVTAGLVMAAWTAALLAVAGFVFRRRDA
jgi:ABC-2 type transport system permease protein